MNTKGNRIAGGCYLYGSDAFFAGVIVGKARSIMANSRDAGVAVFDFSTNRGYVRALTPLEYWRFMGFSEKDYQAARGGQAIRNSGGKQGIALLKMCLWRF